MRKRNSRHDGREGKEGYVHLKLLFMILQNRDRIVTKNVWALTETCKDKLVG
jgi:hypothetical protein